MDYIDAVQRSIDYIEENIRSEIKPDELARQAGFSRWYFYRLFQQSAGLPVKQFMVRRRAIHALFAIRNGASMIEAALLYGFETYAGLYKACKREFGFPPRDLLDKIKGQAPRPILLYKEEHPMLNKKQIKTLLASWHMDDLPFSAALDPGGNEEKNTWLVGDRYLLKASVSREQMNGIIKIQKAMADQGLLSMQAVPTEDSREIVETEDAHCALFHRAEGEGPRADSFFSEDGEEKAKRLGIALGKLDNALKKTEYGADEANVYETVRDWALPQAARMLSLSPSWCDGFLQDFSQLWPELPRQIIHRDPCPGNILASGETIGFRLFVPNERNARLFDLCYAATAILSETFSHLDEARRLSWFSLLRRVTEGYDIAANLTQAELRAVPYMVLSIQFICVAWFSEHKEFEQLFHVNRDMTRFMIEHFDCLRLLE